ncbi:hypothetical protein DFJ43DRAFT_1108174 [Lentinula guzmanii]|uniref:Uncharacterized protein n=1 Tax=Lentinula guzmanii TaxID=2804957 RepID=A0AA38J5I5_9AGAR|nr:hypothetical protein DFJ43DRAFT_1108174 [Lentinula guzmanii]
MLIPTTTREALLTFDLSYNLRAGCGQSFGQSYFLQHIYKTENARCRAHGELLLGLGTALETSSLVDSLLSGISGQSVSELSAEEQRGLGPAMVVDPSGDFFGNYDYLKNDFDIDMDSEPVARPLDPNAPQLDDSDDDEDNIYDFGGDDESDWEPLDSRILSPELTFPEGYFEEPLALPHSRTHPRTDSGSLREPYICLYPDPRAGAPIASQDEIIHENLRYHSNLEGIAQNPWAPFSSEIDWKIACWAKLRGPSSTALTELLAINGVCDKLGLSFHTTNELNAIIDSQLPSARPRFKRQEVVVQGQAYEMYFRDILECVRSLFGDAEFAEYLKFVPEKHFESSTCEEQLYHDMHTGSWWWSAQIKLDKHAGPGRTIIPILLSSDKTQVTLFRNKSVYPVYMTIGNIPKEIRRKPSCRAYILIGYLPCTGLEHIKNAASRRRSLVNLFHTPMEDAGSTGLILASGDGVKRHGHPIFAAYISDYPEQILVTCCITGDCLIGRNMEPHPLRNLQSILEALSMVDHSASAFIHACKDAGIKPVFEPFWANLPYSNVYRTITPDILHQLYQGVFKHLKNWVIEAYGAHEIDARCRRLPPNHNIRIFMKGISTLQRVSGLEHSQISDFLLGIIAEAPLPDGTSSVHLVRCLQGLIDFLHIAQYPVHSTTTLGLLSNALTRFHDNKGVFIDLGIRSNFQIPKIHFLNHYVEIVTEMGTFDNFNTEYTERLHIDLAKDAYRATNKKDELSQMTIWLERKEKVLKHVAYIDWSLSGKHPPLRSHWIPPGMNTVRTLRMTKHPSLRVKVADVVEKYGATFFKAAIARFVAQLKQPQLSGVRLDDAAENLSLDFSHVHAYHRVKYVYQDSFTGMWSTADSDKNGHTVPGRFDTALIRITDTTAEPIKINQDTRIAQVRIVFTLSTRVSEELFRDVSVHERPRYLAYLEWFTSFTTPDDTHGLYKVSRSNVEGGCLASVVDIERFICSAHLIPRFSRIANREWTSSTVLEECPSFFVNSHSDRHIYQLFHS